MADTAQQGFQYEKNVATLLKEWGLVEKSFNPAGSTSDTADLVMVWKKKPVNVELKITAASGGSLALQWNKNKKWHFSDDIKNNSEKVFLAELAYDCGAMNQINSNWKGFPAKFAQTSSTIKEEKFIASLYKEAKTRPQKDNIYNRELEIFEELNKELSGKVISDYYKMKKTYYVNIGTNGFFRFGNDDPSKINENCRKRKIAEVPVFANAAKVKWRTRVQAKGGGNWQYTFELSFSVSKSNNSPYNIGPIDGNSVNIQKSKLSLDCFL